MKLLIALLVTATTAGAHVGAQQSSMPPRSPAGTPPRPLATTPTIIGRVTTTNGLPVRSAQVLARPTGGVVARTAITDGQGAFELQDLRAGTWSVVASKAGFVSLRAGQRHPRQPETPVRLTTDARVAVDFVLPRGAALTGALLDAFGDSVAGAAVEVLHSRIIDGRRQLAPAGFADRTDDAGEFRIHSLPAGDYYIAARMRAATADEPAAALGANVGLPTYFPGTVRLTEAQRITVGPGEERTGLTFAVTHANPVRVSGIVVSSTGTLAEGADLELLSISDASEAMRPFGNFGQTHPGGQFGILSVAPGEYVLAARVSGGGAEPEMGFVPLTVGDGDMSGIVVETSPGTTITGVLNAAPGSALPAGLRATVSAHPLRRGTPGRSTSSDRGTGIFTLDGLFGPVTLAVSGLPDGWAVQSVELAGTDVTDRPIDFPPRSRFQATIVVTPRTGTVNGIVTSNRGASQESHIVVFPGDEAKWTYASRFLRSVTQDRQARFRVVSLPPSERYFAIAVDYLEDGELYDPEVLGRLRERATPFSLAGGETRSLELPLVLR